MESQTGNPCPAEIGILFDHYEEVVGKLLESRASLRAAGRPDDWARVNARIADVDVQIKRLSDQCAAEVAALLRERDGRKYLRHYWGLRFPSLFVTELDGRLASLRQQHGDGDLLNDFEEAYWARLQEINQRPRAAAEAELVAQRELARGKISFADLEAVKNQRKEAMKRREEAIDQLSRELDVVVENVQRKEK